MCCCCSGQFFLMVFALLGLGNITGWHHGWVRVQGTGWGLITLTQPAPVPWAWQVLYTNVSHSRPLCYVSVTMSTWSLSPTIIIIITPIRDTTVVYYHHHPPPITQTFSQVNPWATPRSRLLWVHCHYSEFTIILRVHHHWHILCQCYSVIIGGYHLSLFTQHLDLQLVFQGTGMHGMIFYIYHMFILCLRIYL